MTTTSTAVTIPVAGAYRIDADASTVTFATRHLFGLAPVRGTFRFREGDIRVAGEVGESTARALVDAASFHTGQSTRDGMVRSRQYLDAANHPDIVFDSTALDRRDGEWVLAGTLTVRGASAPVDVRVDEVRQDGSRLRLRAVARVDRYAFGITAMRGMTGRRLTVRLEVVAARG